MAEGHWGTHGPQSQLLVLDPKVLPCSLPKSRGLIEKKGMALQGTEKKKEGNLGRMVTHIPLGVKEFVAGLHLRTRRKQMGEGLRMGGAQVDKLLTANSR